MLPTHRRQLFVWLSYLALSGAELQAQAPQASPVQDDPFGSGGAFKPQVETGGSYSPHNGNGTRSITDLVVPGAVGSGLNFTRHWNSTHESYVQGNSPFVGPGPFGFGGWTHSWNWVASLDSKRTCETCTPETQFTNAMFIKFPDGRKARFESKSGSQEYWLWPDWKGEQYSGDYMVRMDPTSKDFWLYVSDGSAVRFHLDASWQWHAIEVRDPNGLLTTLTYDEATGELQTVRGPDGRELRVTWKRFFNPADGNYSNRMIWKVETGTGLGSQGVEYSYTWQNANNRALAGATYFYKGNPVPDEASSYTYDWWDTNGRPVAASIDGRGPLLRLADDSRFEGPMTRIQYVFRGGPDGAEFCHSPNPQNPVSPYGPYLTMVPFPVEEELHPHGYLVSRFVIPCNGQTDTGTRKETRGAGGQRLFYYGRAGGPDAGAPPASGGHSADFELTKLTQFSDDPASAPFEFRHYLDWHPWRAFDARGALTQYQYEPSFRTNDPFHSTPGRRDGTSRVKRIERRTADNRIVARTFDRTNSGLSENRDTTLLPNPYKQWLFKETDERNFTTTYTRDSRRRVKRIDYADGRSESFTYNDFNNEIATHRLANDAVKTNLYYPVGHPWQGLLWKEWNSADPGGENDATIYTYDALHRVETISHAWSRAKEATFSVRMTYNARHQVVTEEYPATDGSAINPTKEYRYDGYGNCTAIRNELGAWSTFTYDDYRRCTSYTEPLNAPDWNGNGNPGVASRTWNWVYDRVNPNGTRPHAYSHTSKKWRLQHEPAFNEAGQRRTTERRYDYQDNMLSETTGGIMTGDDAFICNAGECETRSFTYDNNGNKLSSKDPLGRVTDYVYDSWNRLTETKEPKRAEQTTRPSTKIEYDDTDNKTLVIFPDGQTQKWLDHDQFGQPWRFIDERDQTTNLTYIWGPMKKLYTVTTHRAKDGGGMEDQLTISSYDPMGRPQTTVFPDQSNEYRGYKFGQLEAWKTRKNQIKNIVYDARGREDYHFWEGDSAPGIDRTWDVANRLTQIANAVATIDYTYDDAAQALTETSTITGAGGAGLIKYFRYPDGMAAHIGYPGGVWVRHDYTARGQLKTVYDNTGGYWKQPINYTYLPDGKVDHQDYSNEVSAIYTYDGRGMVKSVQQKRASGQELTMRTYHRDNRDRITAFQKGSGNPVNPMEDGRGDHYWYDEEGQLTDARYGAIDPVNNPHSFVRGDQFRYDQLGNRMNVPGMANSNYVASRSQWMDFTREDNGLNQYRAWWPFSAINYDDDIGGTWGAPGAANGVLMQDGNITAGFNALNQPMYIWSTGTGWTNFGFDPLGRCVKRWSDVSPAPTYFYYDGWNLIREGPSATSASRLYIHGGRVDEIVKQIRPSDGWERFFHYDASSHCTFQTDAFGNIVEQYYYDAFGYPYFYDGVGNYLGHSPWGNRFLFTGREWLSGLRLYDYRNRLYQPELGRFLQPDPKHFAAGDYNLYRYCHNDPINKTDPTGLSFIGKIIRFIVVGGKKGDETLNKLETMKDAVRAQKEGEDVKMKSEKLAREVARKGGDGATPIKEVDKATGTPHYHDAGRKGGHVLYNIAGALTISGSLPPESGAFERGAAFVLDLFNPLSIPQDILDVRDAIRERNQSQ